MIDSEGYKLVEKKFSYHGYTYTFVEQLDKNWRIYAVSNSSGKIFDYELVRFKKCEEREMAGNKIPKKWFYPTAPHFGIYGFSCQNLISARILHKKILKRKEEHDVEDIEVKIELPINKEFMVKDLIKEKGYSRTNLDLLIKSLGNNIRVVREIKNKTGRDSKVLVYSP